MVACADGFLAADCARWLRAAGRPWSAQRRLIIPAAPGSWAAMVGLAPTVATMVGSEAFRNQHPAFLKVLAWALERGGRRMLKATSLEKQRSITLLAERDPEAKKLIAKSLHTFGKDTFVQYLTEKCQVKEKSFFVAKLRG